MTRPPVQSLLAARSPLASPEAQIAALDAATLRRGGENVTFRSLLACSGATLTPTTPRALQINVGKLCNMTCRHCHVDAGPDRTDAMMDDTVVDACLDAIDRLGVTEVDITGGAPELHPAFRRLVTGARERGAHVMDRCNLTVLLLPRNADLADFLAQHHVEIVASLPHFAAPATDEQRGDGTWEKSLRALRLLNERGYGTGDPARRLTLVSNPVGTALQCGQTRMECVWKTRLAEDHGVTFDRLFLLNNLPISRFLESLLATGALDAYLQQLLDAFNPATVPGLMCRDTISVGWDGRVHDCDFNQMLDLDAVDTDGRAFTIAELTLDRWLDRTIRTGRHCLGCTAGAGSSCGGATT
ncbi:MAG: radical SAM/Cys-rich domain protein [Deltaproteobacteria bacterium]|nr:MAG: radical SAM/Cys-rich domain protein [Deltaproteobacteria bacterium]